MKLLFKHILMLTAFLFTGITLQAQIKNAITTSAKVYGNCGMCKSKIEKAGNLKLTSKVVWNNETQLVKITYDAKKTSVDAILKRIADVGYDNEKYQATDEVYNNLHGCCQYDRVPKEQLIKVEDKVEEASIESSTMAAQNFSPLKIGDAMPAITLSNILGKNISITDFKNKWVFIDFWASWCKPCRIGNKELVKLFKQTERKNLEIISISLDTDKAQWKKAVTIDQLRNIQLIDPNGFEAKTATTFGVEQIPSSFLFNPNGVLVEIKPNINIIKTLINSK